MERTETPGDADLLAIRSGDSAAFRRLYDCYQGPVLATAYAILGDWGSAEDVCQEVFVKVYNGLDRFQLGTNFRAWLLTIAHHSAIDVLRRRKCEGEVPDDLPGQFPDPDARRAFQDMLRPLSPDERLVVTLKYREDLPYRDISRIIGKAEGSLRNLVCGALKKLRVPLDRGGVS